MYSPYRGILSRELGREESANTPLTVLYTEAFEDWIATLKDVPEATSTPSLSDLTKVEFMEIVAIG